MFLVSAIGTLEYMLGVFNKADFIFGFKGKSKGKVHSTCKLLNYLNTPI